MASTQKVFVPKFTFATRISYMGAEGKRFQGYDFIPVRQAGAKKRYEIPPPPPTMVGAADVERCGANVPTECCRATCSNKAKFARALLSPEWYCGKHLSKECRKFEYKARHQHESRMCAVCHDDIELTENAKVTSCGHSFHEDCLLEWNKRKSNCPVCRAGVYDNDPETRRLIHDNLLVKNLYIILKTMNDDIHYGFHDIFSETCMEYLEKRYETSKLWQDTVEYMRRDLLIDSQRMMLKQVVKALIEDGDVLRALTA